MLTRAHAPLNGLVAMALVGHLLALLAVCGGLLLALGFSLVERDRERGRDLARLLVLHVPIGLASATFFAYGLVVLSQADAVGASLAGWIGVGSGLAAGHAVLLGASRRLAGQRAWFWSAAVALACVLALAFLDRLWPAGEGAVATSRNVLAGLGGVVLFPWVELVAAGLTLGGAALAVLAKHPGVDDIGVARGAGAALVGVGLLTAITAPQAIGLAVVQPLVVAGWLLAVACTVASSSALLVRGRLGKRWRWCLLGSACASVAATIATTGTLELATLPSWLEGLNPELVLAIAVGLAGLAAGAFVLVSRRRTR